MLRIRIVPIADVDPDEGYLVLRKTLFGNKKKNIPDQLIDLPVVLEESDLTGEWFEVPTIAQKGN